MNKRLEYTPGVIDYFDDILCIISKNQEEDTEYICPECGQVILKYSELELAKVNKNPQLAFQNISNYDPEEEILSCNQCGHFQILSIV